MKMSPSGKVLAIAGASGVQVFHFNGANSVTAFSGLMTRDEVDQMFWDDANHLYAVSRSAGKLFVFTVTDTSCRPAPGSPYTIGSPLGWLFWRDRISGDWRGSNFLSQKVKIPALSLQKTQRQGRGTLGLLSLILSTSL